MYRILTYRTAEGASRCGIRFDDTGEALDAAELLGDPALGDIAVLLERLDTLHGDIAKASRSGQALPPGPAQVPLPAGATAFCAAANFTDHMLAMAKKLGIDPEPNPHSLDVKPYHFIKAGRQCFAPDGAVVALPDHAENYDWEVELAAVIGRPARNVGADRALEHVAGYLVANDLSARDRTLMKRPNVPDGSLFRTDFIGMKSFDGSCPVSAEIVPARFVPDPQKLDMELSVNGAVKQQSSTAQMIFSAAEQIAMLSTRMTLLPGDLVLTGTPAGTGAESDTFLKPGDRIDCGIEGIGRLTTTIAG